jgi:hypothetical protein
MKIKDQDITTEEILEHWKQGKSTLDWRPLTIKGKREWLKAVYYGQDFRTTK